MICMQRYVSFISSVDLQPTKLSFNLCQQPTKLTGATIVRNPHRTGVAQFELKK